MINKRTENYPSLIPESPSMLEVQKIFLTDTLRVLKRALSL